MIQAPIVSNLESLFASARYNYLSTLPNIRTASRLKASSKTGCLPFFLVMSLP